MDYTAIMNVAGEVDFATDSTVSRTIHQDDSSKAVLFAFDAKQELSEHTAAMPAVLLFIEGQARVSLGDETLEATAGTFIHMAPHLPHSISAEVPTKMLLLLMKASKSKPS
ncbi:cupin domain-containing protein [Aeoliella mucimassa]|uniref:AraC-type arabinose-binding/dimerisation domain-containing protein n=1 Tax=Aeoliella mucimassa TaxID=2527972 RepID=A0A518AN33_9BACT|nr:cupin domain-containing protein [Aeoliella mucimassa]QDU56130.1 hypothetical protein Pan181_23340 [Aeoliella mucimassa]